MLQSKNILNDMTVKHFGKEKTNEIVRRTIVAVIYNPIENKYLCQFWQNYDGLTCLLSGGVEAEEEIYDALSREIIEETGLIDFDVLGILGGDIYSHYTKKTTNENFVKVITPFLVVLKSLSGQSPNKEEDESFENEFRDFEEILKMMQKYESISGSKLEDHKEILDRGVSYIRSHPLDI